ncbi:hypothetical protein [Butyrivibrio sp. WCD2001]|uniref:hypothetical protein n=1 Tax=Butyrivibrio sp. WCD2001 TaxID=1280681 RepID=UPI000401AA2A|nr:hypothetical protein [Butyrivibrio sp. WCD2001]
MKRRLRNFIIILLVIVLFNCSALNSNAAFNDLKKSGCSFNFTKGSWITVYSQVPGKKGLSKFYAKITKFRMSEYPSSSGTSSSSSQSTDSTMTVIMTIQVQNPKKPSKKMAKKLINSGHDFIDYLDVVVVDKSTGENLNTAETSEEGTNYHAVNVTETEWKGLKPQKMSWSDGTVYQYYVSYVKTIVIKFPSNYTKTCVGICGTHVGDYEKMTDWNEGFIEGYTVLSDTTHVKLGSKKKTSQLSHFINIKKPKQAQSTSGNSSNSTTPYRWGFNR